MIDLSITVHYIMFVKLGILYYIHVAMLYYIHVAMFSTHPRYVTASHFFLFVCGRCGNQVMRIFILVHFGYYFRNDFLTLHYLHRKVAVE